MPTGAESPDSISHAFVLKGYYLAYAMWDGETADGDPTSRRTKHIENRPFRLSPGWYAVILGKGKTGVTKQEAARFQALLPSMQMPPFGSAVITRQLGSVVGVVRVSHSLPQEACRHSHWANGARFCNIISEAGRLPVPIPCKGNLGACPIKDDTTLTLVRNAADGLFQKGQIFKTNGEREHPPQYGTHKRKSDCKDNVEGLTKFLKATQRKF